MVGFNVARPLKPKYVGGISMRLSTNVDDNIGHRLVTCLVFRRSIRGIV